MSLALFSIIVATDGGNGIAKNSGIPWNSRSDMKFFRDTTYGRGRNTVIMGRITYESLPEHHRPLQGRHCVVVSRTWRQEDYPEISVCNSLLNALITVGGSIRSYDEVFIAGGEQLYHEAIRNFMYLCQKIYVTRFKTDYVCDQFFPWDEVKDYPTSQNTQKTRDYLRHFIAPKVFHEEYQYLDALKGIQSMGEVKPDRTGVGTISIFGVKMRFDISERIPVLTTKKVNYENIIKELLFFVSGKTDTRILEEQGVKIWKANTTRKFLDDRGLEYEEGDMGPCFVAGTPILTQDGYKNIEKVTEEDLLYTHKGNFKCISQIQERSFTGDLIKIRVRYHPYAISSTPEHPYYARAFSIKGPRYRGDRNRISYEEPQWIEASLLKKKSHLVGFRIEQKETIPYFWVKKYVDHKIGLQKYIKYLDDPNYWFMMGYFVGNGWIKCEDRNKGITFVVDKNQVEDIVPKLRKVLHFCIHNKTNEACIKYKASSSEWFQILEHFGKYPEKRIPDWVHKAPKEFIQEFLNGYSATIECDCFVINYTTVSRDLAFSIQRLYLKLGIIASVRFQKNDYYVIPNNTGCRCNFRTPTYNGCECNFAFIEREYVWYDISSIEKEEVNEIKVYNFSVEDDNSYTVLNTSVHNCYPFQWRHWNAKYDGADKDYTDKGIDQLQNLVKGIRDDPHSRRHILTAWNPEQLDQMVLPPCHTFAQFNVSGDRKYLDCQLYQRSADMFLGVPYNIVSYTLLTYMIAHITSLRPRSFIHIIGDGHIYNNHGNQVSKQLGRTPRPFPKLSFRGSSRIHEIDDFTFDSFIIEGYTSWPHISAPMAV